MELNKNQWEVGLVSIITPVYNAEEFIAETIQSVINQSFSNWELMLIDDASQDQSSQTCQSFAEEDSRIRYHRLPDNQGAAVARNKGLELARGQYIAFIDSDDKWLPDKLEIQVSQMEAEDTAFTFTDFALVNESGEIIKEQTGVPSVMTYSDLLKNTTIACSTVVIDRGMIGDFRMPLVRKGQDTATWLMLMRERGIKAYGIQQVLNHYRQVAGSISSDRIGALKRTWNTYYRLEKLPLPKALYYFSHYVFNAIRRRL